MFELILIYFWNLFVNLSILSIFLFFNDIKFYKLKAVPRKQFYCAPLPLSSYLCVQSNLSILVVTCVH
jgi:hypothetical protein